MPEFTTDGSDCVNCAKAQTQPLWGLFHAFCRGCAIRQLALGPVFFACIPKEDEHGREVKKGCVTPEYKTALLAIFGGDDWRPLHAQVKAEWMRLRALRKEVA